MGMAAWLFFSALAAWASTALLFRLSVRRAFCWALGMAFLCGGSGAILAWFGLSQWDALLSAVWSLLGAAAFQAIEKHTKESILLFFFLIQAAVSNLLLASSCAEMPVWAAGLLFAALAAADLLAALFLRRRLPPEDWRENIALSPGQARRKKLCLYGVFAGVCALNSAALLWDGGAAYTVLLSLSGCALLWAGAALVLLWIVCQVKTAAMQAEQQYRSEVLTFMNVIRSQRHDYNFHVQTIAGLIQEDKIDECRAYVHALEQDSVRMNALLPVHDPAISAMIHNFQTLAVRDGLELHIDIQNDLAQIATNVYETNKILSNLLQNALDETKNHADKSYGIWLTILKRGEYCVIRVSNEVEQPLQAEQLGKIFQHGYTTKQGHDGVGLSSIRSLAARYKGIVYTQLEGNVVHFIAKIPINCAKEPAEFD